MEKKQSRPMKLLNAIVSEPYYLLHFLTFFSYLVLRTSAAHVLSAHITDHLLHRIFLIGLTLILDRHLTLWYVVAFTVIHIFTQQPAFQKLVGDSVMKNDITATVVARNLLTPKDNMILS
ncbi:uncharacterized protein LOC125475511 isoform X2 [Pyrus x bretschneideri]|uniref:uncharacterized protein LOC125475511 isoform X2 n=1 Tax=Pyrus x bretschneideri TaxID=225117 RepID=UPI00202FCEE5|nr:uncharacterized protein LOC125475511 isoform X2 [Pyrus x bretschneideri]